MSLIVRPARLEDLDGMFELATTMTMKAVAGEKDGVVVAIGGVARLRGRWFAFASIQDAARPHRIAIMRAAKRLMQDVEASGIKLVYAEAAPDEAKAPAWLTSLGFVCEPLPPGWWLSKIGFERATPPATLYRWSAT